MTTKQFKSLEAQHSRYMNHGLEKQPDIEPHISLAIVSGERVQMKSPAEIVKIARTKIASERYCNRELKFADVFASCNGYQAEMTEWKTKQKERQSKVQSYLKFAAPLMRKAELNNEADAEEIAAQLADVAESVGLID